MGVIGRHLVAHSTLNHTLWQQPPAPQSVETHTNHPLPQCHIVPPWDPALFLHDTSGGKACPQVNLTSESGRKLISLARKNACRRKGLKRRRWNRARETNKGNCSWCSRAVQSVFFFFLQFFLLTKHQNFPNF